MDPLSVLMIVSHLLLAGEYIVLSYSTVPIVGLWGEMCGLVQMHHRALCHLANSLAEMPEVNFVPDWACIP